jgi:hypothetical protein
MNRPRSRKPRACTDEFVARLYTLAEAYEILARLPGSTRAGCARSDRKGERARRRARET